jgi:hypothetical protein
MDDIKQQSDKELAAAAHMLAEELSVMHQELVKRGIECDFTCYHTGKFTVEYTRVTKEKIA